MRYEYRTSGTVAPDILNQLGLDGWHVVGMTYDHVVRHHTVLLEREIPEPIPQPDSDIEYAYTDTYSSDGLPCRVVGPLGFDTVRVQWPNGVETQVHRKLVRNADGDPV